MEFGAAVPFEDIIEELSPRKFNNLDLSGHLVLIYILTQELHTHTHAYTHTSYARPVQNLSAPDSHLPAR